MTSGFKPPERIEERPRETRSHRHRSGLGRRTSIYPEPLIGDSVEKTILAEMCWLLICDGVRRRGVSNGGAVYDELHAAIALAAFGGIIRGDGLRFSKAAGSDGGSGHTVLREKIAYGVRPALGK